MKRLITLIVIAVVLISGLSLVGASSTAKHRATARLFGATPTHVKGHASFDQKKVHGQKCQRLQVHISRALPLQAFPVRINGQMVGTIRANAGGAAKLSFCTKQFKMNGEKTIPTGFPKLDTGDMICVGPLQGVFFDKHDKKKQKFAVCGFGENGVGVQANVEYREHSKNGSLDRMFTVELNNAEPWQSVPVFVNDAFVGALEPGDDGHATLVLRTEAFIGPDGGAQPMPNEFPSLQPGDTVQVGDMTITLGDCDGGGGGGNGGDDGSSDDDDSSDDGSSDDGSSGDEGSGDGGSDDGSSDDDS